MRCANFGMFCYFLFPFFNSVISPAPGVIPSDHYHQIPYRLVSNPSQCIEVLTAHSVGPSLIKMVIDFELHHEDIMIPPLLRISARYYFRDSSPCNQFLVLSSVNLRFRYINLQITLYSTTEFDGRVAKIDYVLKSGLEDGHIKLIDTQGNFLLRVQFVHNGNEHIPPTINDRDQVVQTLKTKNDPATRLCVVTANSKGVVLEPQFPPGSVRKGTVFEMTYQYIGDHGISQQYSHKVWDCSGSYTDPTLATFVRDQQGSSLLVTKLSAYNYLTDSIEEQTFNIPRDKIVEFADSVPLPMSEKVYLMRNVADMIVCPTSDEVFTYRTSEGSVYWAQKWDATTYKSAEKREWLPVDTNQLCPKAQ